MATPKSGYKLVTDVAYGIHPRQQLDVYIPNTLSDILPNTQFDTEPNTQLNTAACDGGRQLPVLLFVHGGSWQNGSKDDYLFLGESFSKAGFVVAVINYRLAPKYVYPAYVEDTTLAIKWLYAHAADFGGDAQRLFVVGHSAGAFNAISAVNDPRFFAKYGVADHVVKAAVGISGPYSYDFTIDPSRVAFSADAHPIDVMPNHHVRQNPVPHLLLIASKDTLVKDFNTHDMADALQAAGGQVEVVTIKNATHISIIAAVSSRLEWTANTKAVVLDFLAQHL